MGQIYDNVESIIDYTSVVEGVAYNYKLEVSEDGIKWHTIFDGTRNTSTNSFTLSGFQQGITTINADGIKVEHSGSNEYSMIRHDGFVRKWQYGESEYLNDVWVATYHFTGHDYNSPPPYTVVELPERFRGRGDNVEIFLSIGGFDMFLGDSNNPYIGPPTIEVQTVLEVHKTYFDRAKPEIYVNNYIAQKYETSEGYKWDYGSLSFMIMVIGG